MGGREDAALELTEHGFVGGFAELQGGREGRREGGRAVVVVSQA